MSHKDYLTERLLNDDNYRILHAQGYSNDRDASVLRHINKIIDLFNTYSCKNAIDYGCGKGQLVRALNERGVRCDGYDPYSGYEKIGDCYDMVISTDVLEHFDLDQLHDASIHIKSFNPIVMYHSIYTDIAQVILPDGNNAHRTIQSPIWWREKLTELFDNYKVVEMQESMPGYHWLATYILVKK